MRECFITRSDLFVYLMVNFVVLRQVQISTFQGTTTLKNTDPKSEEYDCSPLVHCGRVLRRVTNETVDPY